MATTASIPSVSLPAPEAISDTFSSAVEWTRQTGLPAASSAVDWTRETGLPAAAGAVDWTRETGLPAASGAAVAAAPVLRDLLGPALLGIASGLRSSVGIAVLAWGTGSPRRVGSTEPLDTLRSPTSRKVTAAMVAGEVIGDKLPKTPSRLDAPGFLPRIVLGSVVGYAHAQYRGRDTLPASVVGGVTAALGAFVGHKVRLALNEQIGNVGAGLAEDVLTVGIAAGGLAS